MLIVSNIEASLPQPNYSYNTMTALQKKYAPSCQSFLVGDDQLKSFSEWHRAKKFLESFELLVILRMEDDKKKLQSYAQNCIDKLDLEHPWENYIKIISASVSNAESRIIRKDWPQNTIPLDWLSTSVAEYIKEHHLYTKSTPSSHEEKAKIYENN